MREGDWDDWLATRDFLLRLSRDADRYEELPLGDSSDGRRGFASVRTTARTVIGRARQKWICSCGFVRPWREQAEGVVEMPMHQDWSKYQDGEPPTADSQPPGVLISADTLREQRLPAGQVRTRKWPVLHWKEVPPIGISDWTFFVRGLVDRELVLDWDTYRSLPRVKVFADFHCVTRWSRLGNVWEGVPVREILSRVGVQSRAKYVLIHGHDGGFTTNLPLLELLAEDVLLCDMHDGEPLTADHGGPVRLIVPRLYAWKSVKWLSGMEFLAADSPGFWERNGYHPVGDPWREQRYSW